MTKQIIIARKDLSMSPGKLAAQCSHASIAFLANLIRDPEHTQTIKKRMLREFGDSKKYPDDDEVVGYDFEYIFDKDTYENWICGAFTKVILEARNKNHLLKAANLAEKQGLQIGKDYFLIYDNCYTELISEETDGTTLTCIGFRPLSTTIVDHVAKKYQLYRG